MTPQQDSNADDDADNGDGVVEHDRRPLFEKQRQPLRSKTKMDHRMKQHKSAQHRSILKNSHEWYDDYELLEAKKQLILKRRRLFSHYRQYEQWRRRQFSYDPCYYRANPLPIGQAACNDYASFGGATAFRRRRQYRRQYSCAERSREDSRESQDSAIQHNKYQNMEYSDTINTTDVVALNYKNLPSNHSERNSFDNSECEALTFQYLHCNSRHFHMLQEEPSTSISERCTRSRINSAIFVSSEGRGFDSIEFLRRHGSQSVLCRKARSAENITDNERKKDFSEKLHWRTADEAANESGTHNKEDIMGHVVIELQECNPSKNEATTMPATATSNLTSHSAAVTTSNVIIGSISLEAPPASLKDDIIVAANTNVNIEIKQPHLSRTHLTMSSTHSASHDSTDTVEEIIIVPTETKSRFLVHQRSSTASSNCSQSPAHSTPHSSPKSLNMQSVKPKINTLPLVSVSRPSPKHENPPPSDSL